MHVSNIVSDEVEFLPVRGGFVLVRTGLRDRDREFVQLVYERIGRASCRERVSECV